MIVGKNGMGASRARPRALPNALALSARRARSALPPRATPPLPTSLPPCPTRTGKSNVYDAIRFVLGDQWGNLRATQAADLLNVRNVVAPPASRARAPAPVPLCTTAPTPHSPPSPRRTACQTA